MGYYMGDYYRGDPGFFSFLGGLAKKAVGFIPGVGPALSQGLDVLTAKSGSSAIVKASETGLAGKLARVTAGAKQVISKHPVLSAAGAAGAVAGGSFLAGRRSARASGAGHKHRRMNPCNVKALRRASRRAHAFLRISRKLVGYYQAKKPKGRAFIKSHARKR